MSHVTLRSVVCGVVLIAVGALARAGDTLNPKTYTSPDGAWSLHVAPQTKEGDAGAAYVVSRGGEKVWSQDLPFALWDAAITDAGVVVGYAYEHGLDGMSIPNRGSDHNYLYVVLIDESGQVRLKDQRPRHHPAVMSNPPSPFEPVASGISVDAASDTFVVRIESTFEDDNYYWWRYRLSTGERLGDITPAQPHHAGEYGFHREIAVLPVLDTPLLLIHWYVPEFQDRGSRRRACMQLIDLEGREHWRLDLPDEYSTLGSDWHWYFDLVELGITQVEVARRRFTIPSYSLAARIDFELSPDGAAGWQVKEIARAADRLPAGRGDVPVAAEVPLVSLELLGSIRLGVEVDAGHPIDDVRDFSIDEQGRFGFVRNSLAAAPVFTLVSREGEIVRQWSLGNADASIASETTWLAPGKWLVYETGLGDAPAGAAVLDVETGEISRLETGVGGIRTVTRTANGGFALIGGEDWVMASTLMAFDASGQFLWSAGLFSPQDLCLTSTGEIVVVENISNKLRYFSDDGTELRELDIMEAIGGEPNYPTGVAADADGGVILNDFGGEPAVFRISAEGKTSSSFTPGYSDGRLFHLFGDVQRGPDGTLWTSDSHALLRLSELGVVETVLGRKPGEGGIERIRGMAIGLDGNVYAVNERDGRIHVFSSIGQLLTILEPSPDDFNVVDPCDSLAVTAAGEVYCLREDWSSHNRSGGYVRFASDGRRVGFEPWQLDTVTEEWIFKPGTTQRWILGYHGIALTDESGKIIKTIDKRPNGDWLERVDTGAVSPDGSLAVIASPDEWGMRGPVTINIYGPDAEPIATLPLECKWIINRIVFTGDTVVSTEENELRFHPISGDAGYRAALPVQTGQQDYWFIFLGPDGKELWARNADSAELMRFRLPDRASR